MSPMRGEVSQYALDGVAMLVKTIGMKQLKTERDILGPPNSMCKCVDDCDPGSSGPTTNRARETIIMAKTPKNAKNLLNYQYDV